MRGKKGADGGNALPLFGRLDAAADVHPGGKAFSNGPGCLGLRPRQNFERCCDFAGRCDQPEACGDAFNLAVAIAGAIIVNELLRDSFGGRRGLVKLRRNRCNELAARCAII